MRKVLKSVTLASAAVLGVSAFATVACAGSILALNGDRTIIKIDLETATVIGSAEVTGGGSRLAGIDIRPADGKVYGLFTNGQVAIINPNNGVAKVRCTIAFDFSTAFYSVDFNPVSGGLRIVGDDDSNMRANVDDCALTTNLPITSPNPNPFGDSNVRIVGVAYTNSVSGARATQLYDIDRRPAALYRQVPPDSGTLAAVGPLSFRPAQLGFDIAIDANSVNHGLVLTRNRLYEIDLAGGAQISSTVVQGLDAEVRDITVRRDPTD